MKTHSTAIVVIPPPDIWEPIQAIRRLHDRQFRRWMPHLTLIYPFRPVGEFQGLAAPLSRACLRVQPFRIELREVRYFGHRSGSCTLWLSPEPPEPLARLQALLEEVVPDCDDVRLLHGGFTPHLSVGQAHGEERAAGLLRELEAAWRPLEFTAREVSLIWRGEPPDDVFRVERTISLGSGAQHRPPDG